MNALGTFAAAQALYAAHGIATFPLRENKHPAIRGYNRVGLSGSLQLARKFRDATALGFMTNERTRITGLDIDTTNENVFADALQRHGETPVKVRTASGKFHAWYRHNGERRRIRPFGNLPIDLLGQDGLIVAPPSHVTKGNYAFIEGGLDDLDRLPVMRGLSADMYARTAQPVPGLIVPDDFLPNDDPGDSIRPLRGMVEHDGRNATLFRVIGTTASEIHAAKGTRDQLFDVAQQHNAKCIQPMTVAEVSKVVDSVWRMTIEGRNCFGQHGAFMGLHEVNNMVGGGDQDAFLLLAFLRAHQRPWATFWIANGLTETLGWTVKRLANARKRLLQRGYVEQVRLPWRGTPAEYVWSQKSRVVRNDHLYSITPLSLFFSPLPTEAKNARLQPRGSPGQHNCGISTRIVR